jgi:hypothetical protein
MGVAEPISCDSGDTKSAESAQQKKAAPPRPSPSAFFTSVTHLVRPAPGTSRWHAQPRREARVDDHHRDHPGRHRGGGGDAFRVLGHAIRAAVFLIANGLILFAAECYYHTHPPSTAPRRRTGTGLSWRGPGRRPARARSPGSPCQGIAEAVLADQRPVRAGCVRATIIGAAQILALRAGISRHGTCRPGTLTPFAIAACSSASAASRTSN